MRKNILENINISRESRSYIDCLHALLTAAKLFDLPKDMLSGMTGMAFKFIIHKKLLPSSLDMYNWSYDNWRAANILGIYSEIFTGSPLDTTFPLYQRNMIKKIRQSIDEGKAVIAWGLSESSYSLITGYSDCDRVFFFRHSSQEDEVILYDNIGMVDEGSWFFQIVGEKIEKDVRNIYRESLEIAVNEWNYGDEDDSEYGQGKNAYRYLVNALRSGEFSQSGAYYILDAYINAKKEIGTYMSEVAKEIPALSLAASQYGKLACIYKQIGCIPVTGRYEEDIKYIPEALGYFNEATKIEESAIAEVARYLARIMSNRRINPARLKDL